MGKATSGTKRGRNRAGESFENERRKVSDGGRRKRYRNYLDISFGVRTINPKRVFVTEKAPIRVFLGCRAQPVDGDIVRSFVEDSASLKRVPPARLPRRDANALRPAERQKRARKTNAIL